MTMRNNKIHFSSREVAAYIFTTSQTVVNLDKYSKILEERGESRLIPVPVLEGNMRYWNIDDLMKIIEFRKSISSSTLSDYNVIMWNERRKELKQNKI